nr:anthrone oxygenase family protein [Nocardioides sp. zg-DK7169]
MGGLQAGTYYAWASGVMPGLGRVDDRTFVAVMREVNRAIVNPVFLASFLGAPLTAGAAALAASGTPRCWAVAGTALAVATVAVTGARNVPLNDALEAGGGDPAAARAGFERAWRRWNVVRTLTSTGSVACLGVAACLS